MSQRPHSSVFTQSCYLFRNVSCNMHKESQTISGIRSEIAPQKAWAGADEIKLAADRQLWRARACGVHCVLRSLLLTGNLLRRFLLRMRIVQRLLREKKKHFLDYKKVLTYESKHMSSPQGRRYVYYGVARRPHKL